MGVVLPDKPYFYIHLSQEENLTRSPALEFFVCTWKGRGILGWIYFSGHRLVLSWREIAYIQRGQLFFTYLRFFDGACTPKINILLGIAVLPFER